MIALIEDSDSDVYLYKETFLQGVAHEHFKCLADFKNSHLDFDCVILDLNLPDGMGAALVSEVSEVFEGDIFVITGMAGDYFTGAAYKNLVYAGAKDVFLKHKFKHDGYFDLIRDEIVK